jgi:arylsulfatase
MEHMFMVAPAAAYVGQALQSFAEFPPRQKPGTFNLSAVMDIIMSGAQR